MSESTHFTGQPVYSQVIKLLDKAKIQQISLETLGCERYVKRLTGWNHLIIMLFGLLKHFDSLRELEIGMKAETRKLSHLGLNYLVRRSTLAEANQRRSQEFFAKVYASLLERYSSFLADSRSARNEKPWIKQLYMMDSTTITLFDNILKGVGRHPKSGKKKGGMKVHTVMKYQVGVPMVAELTSAAKHDHYLLKEVHLPKDSTLAMDRAYIDYGEDEEDAKVYEFDLSLFGGKMEMLDYQTKYHDVFTECHAEVATIEQRYPDFRVLTVGRPARNYVLVSKAGKLFVLNLTTGETLTPFPIDACHVNFNGVGFTITKGRERAFFNHEGRQLTDFRERDFSWSWSKCNPNSVAVKDTATGKIFFAMAPTSRSVKVVRATCLADCPAALIKNSSLAFITKPTTFAR